MTYRQLVWRTYWRNCIFWFCLMYGGTVAMTTLHHTPDSYKAWILPLYLVGLIGAMFLTFRLINDWVRQDLKKVIPRSERPKPEDFIWNHPWPVALKHLAFNLLVVLPAIFGGFIAFACAWIVITFSPLLAGYWLLPKLLGPIDKSNDWLWIALLMPFSFVSCCGFSMFFVWGFVFDERMKSNPSVA